MPKITGTPEFGEELIVNMKSPGVTVELSTWKMDKLFVLFTTNAVVDVKIDWNVTGPPVETVTSMIPPLVKEGMPDPLGAVEITKA